MYYKMRFADIDELIIQFEEELKFNNKRDDIEVYSFPQCWGSTALGYSGVGGSAMTSAQTVVLHAINENIVKVYFGGKRLAYCVQDPSREFFKDVFENNVLPQSQASKYRR